MPHGHGRSASGAEPDGPLGQARSPSHRQAVKARAQSRSARRRPGTPKGPEVIVSAIAPAGADFCQPECDPAVTRRNGGASASGSRLRCAEGSADRDAVRPLPARRLAGTEASETTRRPIRAEPIGISAITIQPRPGGGADEGGRLGRHWCRPCLQRPGTAPACRGLGRLQRCCLVPACTEMHRAAPSSRAPFNRDSTHEVPLGQHKRSGVSAAFGLTRT